MGVPKDKDARRFYSAAGQRLEDATFLLENQRVTGAVYLAGYCVECMLKALILVQAGKDNKEEALDSFRGSKAHNFDHLLSQYDKYGGPRPSKRDKKLSAAFVIVGSWDTDLRYHTGMMKPDDGAEFLDAVEQVRTWADGRS